MNEEKCFVPSHGIGAKLRETRLASGLTIADISRETRISSRFLDAIEADKFENLPGHIFARNFVRQYALAMHLDPDPLVAELPKQEEDVRLPDPPQRFSYHTDRTIHSALVSGTWLVLAAGAATAAYLHFNHTAQTRPADVPAAVTQTAAPEVQQAAPQVPRPVRNIPAFSAETPQPEPIASGISEHPVRVVITAQEAAWIQVTTDGKTVFTGTLEANETKEISADQQVKIFTGNAGGLTVSLNGKTLMPLGPAGQVRTVMLTAEGPEFLARAPQPAPDPL
jgi:cytoskeleton protein RodZ